MVEDEEGSTGPRWAPVMRFTGPHSKSFINMVSRLRLSASLTELNELLLPAPGLMSEADHVFCSKRHCLMVSFIYKCPHSLRKCIFPKFLAGIHTEFPTGASQPPGIAIAEFSTCSLFPWLGWIQEKSPSSLEFGSWSEVVKKGALASDYAGLDPGSSIQKLHDLSQFPRL